MKKLWTLLLCVCLLVPTNVFAATNEDAIDESSKLPKMTDTCLGDIISSEDQVVISDETPAGEMMLFATNSQTTDETAIKEVIEEYNKTVFLSIIGHEKTLDTSFSSDQALLDELNARSIYLGQNFGGGTTFTSYNFDIYYDDLAIDGDKAKAVITQDITFQTSFEDKEYLVDADYVREEGYVLQKIDGEWKLVNVIFNSEGLPNDAMAALMDSDSSDEWIADFDFEPLSRDQYEDDRTFTDMLDENGEIDLGSLVDPYVEYSAAYDDPSLLDPMPRAAYSKAACDAYAEKYGRTINNEYRWFEADCTNFASQCIYAGGLPQSAHWYYNDANDYSRSWTVVQDLRDFIMNHTLSAGYYESMPAYPAGVDYRGTLIQYSNGSEWVHSAIVRYYNGSGIYVAEHDGPNVSSNPYGNMSYSLHGTDLNNKRTFWIARGY